MKKINSKPSASVPKSQLSIRTIAKQDKKFLSKYAMLFATVTGFLVITTAFGGLGYKISIENKQNGQVLNAVGLEKTLSQQVSKEILTLQKEWKASRKFNTQSLESLESAKKGFDDLLKGFNSGGTVTYGTQTYNLKALDAYATHLEKIGNAWSPLKTQIEMMSKAHTAYQLSQGKLSERDKFLAARKTFTMEIDLGKDKIFPNDHINGAPLVITNIGTAGDEELSAEITKTSNLYDQYAKDLLVSVETLNASINESIGHKDASNIKIQMLMSAISLMLFFILTFYFIRRNILSDFVIFTENQEKKGILDNINEGVFLMDLEWTVKSKGSKFLHILFNKNIPEGINFKQLLADSVDKETMSNAERFVSVLTGKNIKGSMIDSLNPLKLISLQLKDSMGQDVVKHVSVHFGKVYDVNGELKHLLVGVVDSTEKHKLSVSLKEEIRKNKEAFAQLIMIGKSNERTEIKNLMTSLFDYITDLNNSFKTGKIQSNEYQNVIRSIKNTIHGFKNDAGLLHVDIMQKLLHDLEDFLIQLDKSNNVTSESFVNIPYKFKELFEAIEVINLLIGDQVKDTTKQDIPVETESTESNTPDEIINWMTKSLNLAVTQTAQKLNKLVNFHMSTFPVQNEKAVEYYKLLRAPLIHLVKNSIVHGIETPNKRTARKKEDHGNLWLRVSSDSNGIKLIIQDDGNGINRIAVRNKARELGIISELDDVTQDRANELIFHPGFSTAEEVGLDAGRGVGLDQVKNAVESMCGTIVVTSVEKAGTKFEINIPF